MNIELRRIAHSARLSQETEAFAADIYIDGKKVGDAENDGHGGATMINPHALEDRINDYAKTLPEKDWGDFKCPMDAQIIIGDLLEAHLKAKDEKRIRAKFDKDLATRVLWIKGGKCYSVKLPTDPTQKERHRTGIIAREKARGYVVLNEMPVEEAWALWFPAVTRDPYEVPKAVMAGLAAGTIDPASLVVDAPKNVRAIVRA